MKDDPRTADQSVARRGWKPVAFGILLCAVSLGVGAGACYATMYVLVMRL